MKSSAAAVLLLALACGKAQPPATTASGSGAAASPAAASASGGGGGAHIVFPDRYTVRLEIANDDETRTQGLMYRDHLPDATGMIFLFAQAGEYPFWMKNTLIPLDLIWIDAGHRIVHIAHDVPPCKADPCPNYPPNAIASSVLEVPAGVAAQHHLANGQTLVFEGLDGIAVR